MTEIKTVDDLIDYFSCQAYISADMREEVTKTNPDGFTTEDYVILSTEIRIYEEALKRAKELKANMEKSNDRTKENP